MVNNHVTVIPSYRVSTLTKPEIRVYTERETKLELNILKNGEAKKNIRNMIVKANKTLCFYADISDFIGYIQFEFIFYDMNGSLLEIKIWDYQVIRSGYRSTALIDGCWIEIYHWSEEEACRYNHELVRFNDEDFSQAVFSMKNIGINNAILQNVFYCNEYAGKHNMTFKKYKGRSLYPSELFKNHFPITAADPLEAILTAADKCGMQVFVGVGHFAWFDFSLESLKWHIEVTKELYKHYGHHKSLYGWYISEEIFGSLYYEYEPAANSRHRDITYFFTEYKKFVQALTPTKPVALAPSNNRFHEFEKEWREILQNVDVLLPFGFARDYANSNLGEIIRICNETFTHLWVDMEMFKWPLDDGLVPKSFNGLISEIKEYDSVEQVFGYQYTGIMNHPDCSFDMGGTATKQLYSDYAEYYKGVVGRNGNDT